MLPDVQCVAGWTFVVRYVDMSSRQQRIVGMADISWTSETGGSQSYTAVIGGLASHRKYMVGVYTVTQHGIESCGQVPVTVQTGKHVTGLRHSRHFDSSQCTHVTPVFIRELWKMSGELGPEFFLSLPFTYSMTTATGDVFTTAGKFRVV